MSVRILHISDIHNGYKWDYNNIDDKAQLVTPNIKHDSLELLRDNLLNLKPKPNYIIITGDIAHQGNSDKQSEFYKLLRDLVSIKVFPNTNHIVIVPGNHDVEKTSIKDWQKKFSDFYALVPNGCVLPIKDLSPSAISSYKEQIKYYLTHPRAKCSISLPFVIDKKKKVIIYALNSCQFCQCTVDSGTIDMPRVDLNELEIMRYTFVLLKEHLGAEFYKYITICAMHHNLSSLATFEEDKFFETIPNSGYIKKIFSECNIKLLLHGHKHWPEVYYDTAISDSGGYVGISGSSICQSPNKDEAGYYVIDFDHNNYNTIKTSFRSIETTNNALTENIIKLDPPKQKFSSSYNKQNISDKTCSYLSKYIITNNDDAGWDKLIEKQAVIGTIGSAIGLVIMQENNYVDSKYANNRQTIINTLWKRRIESGGFGAYSNSESFFEATCWVAKAMLCCCEYEKYSMVVNDILEMLKRKSINSLSICTIAFLLSTLITYNNIFPNNQLKIEIESLKNFLIATATKNNEYIVWGNNTGSANDTAHVILSLNQYNKYYKYEKDINEYVQSAVCFLLNSNNSWNDFQERIRLNREEMVYEHYALPWCLCALLDSGVSEYNNIVLNGTERLFSTYRNGVWKRNEVKIWEIHDSLMVIKKLGQNIDV